MIDSTLIYAFRPRGGNITTRDIYIWAPDSHIETVYTVLVYCAHYIIDSLSFSLSAQFRYGPRNKKKMSKIMEQPPGIYARYHGLRYLRCLCKGFFSVLWMHGRGWGKINSYMIMFEPTKFRWTEISLEIKYLWHTTVCDPDIFIYFH